MRNAPGRFIAMLVVLVNASGAQAQICGDVDGVAGVSVSDGVNVLRAAAGLTSPCSGSLCDIDGSGTVSVSDGVATLRIAACLPSEVSCGTRFGKIVKTIQAAGVPADLRIGAPPAPDGLSDVVSITGPPIVRAGQIATFVVQLARAVDSLLVTFSEEGTVVDGFAELRLASPTTSVELQLTAGDPSEVLGRELRIGSTLNGSVGGFQTRPLSILGTIIEIADAFTLADDPDPQLVSFPFQVEVLAGENIIAAEIIWDIRNYDADYPSTIGVNGQTFPIPGTDATGAPIIEETNQFYHQVIPFDPAFLVPGGTNVLTVETSFTTDEFGFDDIFFEAAKIRLIIDSGP